LLSTAAAAAAPFVPRSSGSGEGLLFDAPAAQPQAVTFLRGATRGGVPVPAQSSLDADGLPADEDSLFGLTADARRLELLDAHPRQLVQLDGAPFLLPRGRQGGPDAAAAAVGPLGPGLSALPPPCPPAGPTPGRAPHLQRFSSDALRAELQRRSALSLCTLEPGSEEAERVPPTLHRYHSLVPLEEWLAEEQPSASLGVRSAVIKAVSADSGCAVALRRLDGGALELSAGLVSGAGEVLQRWAPLRGHPLLCAPLAAFAADDGSGEGQGALYVAFEYAPGAVTLAAAHLHPDAPPCAEEQLWAYTVQLACALRAIHGCGLACRPAGLAPTKLLLTTGARLRLSSPGLPDILALQQGGRPLGELQRGDLVTMGHLLLALACGPRSRPSLGALQQRASPRLTQLVAGLLDSNGVPDVGQLAAMLGEASLASLASALAAQEALLGELAREAESGRLLRLVLKLGFVCDGGEVTGDGYLLRLFRDFLFEQGGDWAGAYEALNKLDAGTPERVLLLSKDEASMLVASYADIKRVVETEYGRMVDKQIRGENEARRVAIAGGGEGW